MTLTTFTKAYYLSLAESHTYTAVDRFWTTAALQGVWHNTGLGYCMAPLIIMAIQ